jgi:hypothetical protein
MNIGSELIFLAVLVAWFAHMDVWHIRYFFDSIETAKLSFVPG